MRGKFFIFAGALVVVVAAALWTLFPMQRRQVMPPSAAMQIPAEGRAVSAPIAPPPPAPTPTNSSPGTNVERWLGREPVRLTPEQAEAYVEENHRSVTSLLAARRASGERKYLREAMERFPNDPRVAFDAYYLNGPYDKGPATAERRQWLDRFKQGDPENALPDYLAARDDFKGGRTEQAMQDLQAAAGKSKFDAYLMESLQSTEEAYRAAGYSELDAKSTAAWGLLLPHLSETRQLGDNMAELLGQYIKSGDTVAAQNILQMGYSLGDKVSTEFTLLNTLVGIAIQKKLLGELDPSSPFLSTGNTVQEQLDSLNSYRNSLKAIAPQEEKLLPQMSEADQVSFYERLRMFGEPAAVKWAAEKYGAQ